MKYQYKIIGIWGNMNEHQETLYKFESEYPYTFNVGDEICWPEDWKEEFGGSYTWKIKKIQHYLVENFIAIYVIHA